MSTLVVPNDISLTSLAAQTFSMKSAWTLQQHSAACGETKRDWGVPNDNLRDNLSAAPLCIAALILAPCTCMSTRGGPGPGPAPLPGPQRKAPRDWEKLPKG